MIQNGGYLWVLVPTIKLYEIQLPPFYSFVMRSDMNITWSLAQIAIDGYAINDLGLKIALILIASPNDYIKGEFALNYIFLL